MHLKYLAVPLVLQASVYALVLPPQPRGDLSAASVKSRQPADTDALVGALSSLAASLSGQTSGLPPISNILSNVQDAVLYLDDIQIPEDQKQRITALVQQIVATLQGQQGANVLGQTLTTVNGLLSSGTLIAPPVKTVGQAVCRLLENLTAASGPIANTQLFGIIVGICGRAGN